MLILIAGCALSLASCGNSNDNTTEPGTGAMNEDATMTAPETPDSSAMTNTADTAAAAGQGTPPGSDNPRRNDINGQPHQPGPPMDTPTRNKAKSGH